MAIAQSTKHLKVHGIGLSVVAAKSWEDSESTILQFSDICYDRANANKPNHVTANIKAIHDAYFGFCFNSGRYTTQPLFIPILKDNMRVRNLRANSGDLNFRYVKTKVVKEWQSNTEYQMKNVALKFGNKDTQGSEVYEIMVYKAGEVQEHYDTPIEACENLSPLWRQEWKFAEYEEERGHLKRHKEWSTPGFSGDQVPDQEDVSSPEMHLKLKQPWQKPLAAFRITVEYPTTIKAPPMNTNSRLFSERLKKRKRLRRKSGNQSHSIEESISDNEETVTCNSSPSINSPPKECQPPRKRHRMVLMEDTENASKDTENASKDTENASKDTENASKDTEMISEDTMKLSEDTMKISEDTEKTSEDTEKTSEDSENVSEHTKNASEYTENVSEDIENVSEEMENVSEDIEDAFEDIENIPENPKNAFEDTENVLKNTENASQEREQNELTLNDTISSSPGNDDRVRSSESAPPDDSIDQDYIGLVEDGRYQSDLDAPVSTLPITNGNENRVIQISDNESACSAETNDENSDIVVVDSSKPWQASNARKSAITNSINIDSTKKAKIREKRSNQAYINDLKKKRRLEIKNKQHKTTIQRLENEKKQQNVAIQERENEIKQQKITIQELENQKKQLKIAIQKLENEKGKKETDTQELSADYIRLKEENEKNKQQVEEVQNLSRERESRLQEQFDSTQSLLKEEHEKDLERLQLQHKDEMQEFQQEQEKEKRKMEREIKEKQETLLEMEKDKTELQQKIERLKKELISINPAHPSRWWN